MGRLAHYLLCGRVLIVLLNSRYVDKLFSSVVLTSLSRAKQISYFKHTPDAAGALYVALIYCGNNLLGCLVEWTLVCDWFLFRLRKYFHSEGQDTISSKIQAWEVYFTRAYLTIIYKSGTLLKNTTIEHSKRLVTLKTCDQSDEETRHGQQKNKIKTFREQSQRKVVETCDNWDTHCISDNWEQQF